MDTAQIVFDIIVVLFMAWMLGFRLMMYKHLNALFNRIIEYEDATADLFASLGEGPQ